MDKKHQTPVIAETIRRLLDAWALGKRLDPWLADQNPKFCCRKPFA